LVGGEDSELTTKTMILSRCRAASAPGLVQRFEDFQRIEHARACRRCPTRRRRRDEDRAGGRCRRKLSVLERANRARGGSRRIVGCRGTASPMAAASVCRCRRSC
jgi:hypothetical protein